MSRIFCMGFICLLCVIFMSLQSLLYLMCGSFVLCVNNMFHMCLLCVALVSPRNLMYVVFDI